MLEPSIVVKVDSDGLEAIQTRKRWYSHFADNGTLTARVHAFVPRFGHVVRNGRAWRGSPCGSNQTRRCRVELVARKGREREFGQRRTVRAE